MKFLVFGAGAVGGVVGARLAQAGHDVRVVARGAHAAAIRAQGLVVHAPNGTDVVPVPVVDEPAVDDTTIVLLAVKTQDVADALRALAIAAPPTTPVVCMTNGLAAEPQAARWFTHVYGMCVNTPSTYLEPGVVLAWGEPVAGMYDIGRFPAGRDATCDGIAAAFEAAHLWSRSDADIMRWKRGKLLFNLSNALDALCGPAGRTHPLVAELRAEGERVYAAAGLSTTTVDETTARQGAFRTGTLPAYSRVTVGGSTWQSLARGAHVLECEYLNGEIALLGRIHGVPTPANDGVLRAVTRAAAGAGTPPGSLALDALDELVAISARGSVARGR